MDDLKQIAGAILSAFSTSFFEANQKYLAIMAATNEAELNAVEIPEVPLTNG